jgi:CheY-like chemotaxis protein
MLSRTSGPPDPLVLIVDDSEDGRAILSDLLSMYGFDTVTAATGREALSIFASRHPQAAIVDLSMPDMDGFELAAKLRASQVDLPIMAYSGYSGEEIDERARAAGCTGTLVKSMDASTIVATLKTVLGLA